MPKETVKEGHFRKEVHRAESNVDGTPEAEDLLGEVHITVRRKEPYFSVIQVIHFYGDTPRIDFETKIDWHERHCLLKVDFPTAV